MNRKRNEDLPLLVNLPPAASTEVCRWCFKHWDIEHAESMHVPVFHVAALAWYGTSNSKRPLVVTGKEKLKTEEVIVAHFDPTVPTEGRLIPDGDLGDRARQEALYYHKTMRQGTIHYMYWNLLHHEKLAWPGFVAGVPRFEIPSARLLFPLIRFALIKGLNLNEDNARLGIKIVEAGFERAEASLDESGGPFLMGSRFTIADITFAASAAPIVLAKGYGGHMPEFDQLPPNMQEVVSDLRERDGAKFLQWIYDERR